MITICCKICGNNFNVSNCRKNTAKFCSVECKKSNKKDRIAFKYECCGKEILLLESRFKYYLDNNIITCKSCHLKKMRNFIPDNWMSDDEKKKRSARWKTNNPSKDKKNREKISKRMKDNNPTTNDNVIKKIRLSTINQRNNMYGQISPMYNPSSIPILESKAKELNITDLQHAENGGEYYIKELGYWVDGYSPSKNIVLEYDEKHHNRQSDKDLRRQNEIIRYLKCKLIRIKYDGTESIFE